MFSGLPISFLFALVFVFFSLNVMLPFLVGSINFGFQIDDAISMRGGSKFYIDIFFSFYEFLHS